MSKVISKNLHVPLPGILYKELRFEAERVHQPATVLAREAIQAWLRARRKRSIDREVAAYASRFSGTEADLDPDLEKTAIETFLALEENDQ